MQRHTTDVILLALVVLIIGHLSIATADSSTSGAKSFPELYVAENCSPYTTSGIPIYICGPDRNYYCFIRGPEALACGSLEEMKEFIAEMNNKEMLSPAQREMIKDAIGSSTTIFELAATITAYLEYIGELSSSHGESYEQTATRLHDDVMLLAVEREKQLKGK